MPAVFEGDECYNLRLGRLSIAVDAERLRVFSQGESIPFLAKQKPCPT